MSAVFEDLLARHRTVIERYVHYRMPGRFDAEDVIQETYMAAYEGFGRLQDPALFKPWLLSIAKNQVNSWYRKKYRVEYVSLDALLDASDVGNEMDVCTFHDTLSRLPEHLAEILRRILDGYRQEQIAEQLGIPLGTVKSRLHEARRQFRAAYFPDIYTKERGKGIMTKKDYLHGFPVEIPLLKVEKRDMPFPSIRCEEEAFIIPRLGMHNAEGTYRLGRLALVSNCYVPKRARIHEVEGVKICRDTYNLRADHLYKNEAVWFTQLTDEYIRNLASLRFDEEEDTDYPTSINTFLEESYDVCVNGNDRIHGTPIQILENPAIEAKDGLRGELNVRYTQGVYEVQIGKRAFEAIKIICASNHALTVTETFIDLNGRMLWMNWYESDCSLTYSENYGAETLAGIQKNPTLIFNETLYRLTEIRISEYAL
ncbi:MAG: sigma-70 family RNA polymerase sigma factor [Clostridia bacterium]|nr:sigma-70 family RNA polymerase sigma factor [Clostridia bacterium]